MYQSAPAKTSITGSEHLAANQNLAQAQNNRIVNSPFVPQLSASDLANCPMFQEISQKLSGNSTSHCAEVSGNLPSPNPATSPIVNPPLRRKRSNTLPPLQLETIIREAVHSSFLTPISATPSTLFMSNQQKQQQSQSNKSAATPVLTPLGLSDSLFPSAFSNILSPVGAGLPDLYPLGSNFAGLQGTELWSPLTPLQPPLPLNDSFMVRSNAALSPMGGFQDPNQQINASFNLRDHFPSQTQLIEAAPQLPNLDSARTTPASSTTGLGDAAATLSFISALLGDPPGMHQNSKAAKIVPPIQVPSNRKFYRCPVKGCTDVFETKPNLKLHLKTHTEPHEFECEICHVTCKRQSDLNRHKRSIHREGHQYRCQTCQRPFGRKDAYDKHISSCVKQDANN